MTPEQFARIEALFQAAVTLYAPRRCVRPPYKFDASLGREMSPGNSGLTSAKQ